MRASGSRRWTRASKRNCWRNARFWACASPTGRLSSDPRRTVGLRRLATALQTVLIFMSSGALKAILDWLRVDDNGHVVLQLGKWETVHNAILPLIMAYPGDTPLCTIVCMQAVFACQQGIR